jgi:hypothetical protein
MPRCRAGLEIVRKTLGQHVIATVQTTAIESGGRRHQPDNRACAKDDAPSSKPGQKNESLPRRYRQPSTNLS